MILDAGKKLQRRFAQTKPSTPPNVFNLMTTQAMAMKTAHAILTVETQGIPQFLDYSKRIIADAKGKKGNRANKWLTTNSDWKVAHEIANSNKTNHPKLSRLVELIELQLEVGTSKFIIFSEIRHTASLIVEKLSNVNGCLLYTSPSPRD